MANLTFTQGIVRHPANFLAPVTISGNTHVNLNIPTVPTVDPITLAFGHKDTGYLWTEIGGSQTPTNPTWFGPFTGGTDYYLWVDINMSTGIRTFGWSTQEPVVGSRFTGTPYYTPASSGSSNGNISHWYDTNTRTMFFYNGLNPNPGQPIDYTVVNVQAGGPAVGTWVVSGNVAQQFNAARGRSFSVFGDTGGGNGIYSILNAVANGPVGGAGTTDVTIASGPGGSPDGIPSSANGDGTLRYTPPNGFTEVVRLFVARFDGTSTFESLSINAPSFIGTTVGIQGSFEVGSLVYDRDGRPLKRTANNTFFTTEDAFATGLPTSARNRIESLVIDGIAQTPLSAYSMVRFSDFAELLPLTPGTQPSTVYGITERETPTGGLAKVVVDGVVRNAQWDWDFVNQQIFVDGTGALRTAEGNLPVGEYEPESGQVPVALAIDSTAILLRPARLLLTTGGAPTLALDDLTDVTVPSPVDGEALIYNNTSGEWEADTLALALYQLTDVGLSAVTSSLPDGRIIVTDSGQWEDVDLTTTLDADYLRLDATNDPVTGDLRLSQTLRVDGNVGVNTNPAANTHTLEVVGAGSPQRAAQFTGDVQVNSQIKGSNQSASAPTYSFTNDPDTGVYRHSANVLGLAGQVRVNDAYTLPASDGSSGQALVTDGLGGVTFQDVASGFGSPPLFPGDNISELINDAGYLTSVALNDLTDVSVPTPGNGQVLTYTGAQWEAQTVASGVASITGGVDISATVGGSPTTTTIDVDYPLDEAPDGSVSAPTYSFANETNTGVYHEDRTLKVSVVGEDAVCVINRGGSPEVGVGSPDLLSDVGADLHILNDNAGHSQVRIEATDAAADARLQLVTANGSWNVLNDIDDDGLHVQWAGADRFIVAFDGAITFNDAYTFPTADGTTGQVLTTDGAGNITFETPASGVGSPVPFLLLDASNDPLTGTLTINGEGSPQLALIANGDVEVNSQIRASDGSVSIPTYSFTNETDSGWYRSSEQNLCLSLAGEEAFCVVKRGGSPIANAGSPDILADVGIDLHVKNDGAGDSQVRIETDALGANAVLQLITANGTWTVTNDSGDDDLHFQWNGTDRFVMTDNPQLQGTDGAVDAPTYSFLNDTDTGVYLISTGEIGVTTAGTERISVNATRLEVAQPVHTPNGTAGAPTYAFTNDTDTGAYLVGVGEYGIAAAGAQRASLSATRLQLAQAVYAPDGSAGIPSYTFTNDPNTGIYSSTADELSITTGSAQRVSVDATSIDFTPQMRGGDGSAGAPTYSFTSDTGAGIFLPSSDTLGFVTGSVEKLRLLPTGVLRSTVGNYATLLSNDSDIPNKAYVDSLSAGLDPKESVRCATIAATGSPQGSPFESGDLTAAPFNGTYSPTGGSPVNSGAFFNVDLTNDIDSIVVGLGDRVLVKDQADAKQNGIYIVTVAGANGTLDRAIDQDGTPSNEVSGGNFTFVESGSQAGSLWAVIFDGEVTLNTDPVNWSQVSGAAAGTTPALGGLTDVTDSFGPSGKTNGDIYGFIGNGSGSLDVAELAGGSPSVLESIFDAAYLRLDASNDPLTGTLTINGEGSPQVALIANGDVVVNSQIRIGDGSELIPAYSFSASSDTGLYRPNNSTLAFSISGEEAFTVIKLGAGSPTPEFGSPLLFDLDSGIEFVLKNDADGASRLRIITDTSTASSEVILTTATSTWTIANDGGEGSPSLADSLVFEKDGLPVVVVEDTGTPVVLRNHFYRESIVVSSPPEVTVTHNLGEQFVIVQVYDDSSPPQQVDPGTIELVDANNVRLTFSTAFTGTVVISG